MTRQVQVQRGSSRAAQRRRDAEAEELVTAPPGDPRDPDLGDEVDATLEAIDAALEADQ